MSEDENFQRQVSAAIIQLRMHSPFFATLALFARILPSQTISTAATDGRDIFVNLHFWSHLKPAERLGLMAHEVLHVALLHVPRGRKRDSFLWNIAADIVVNGIILSQEGFELPKGHLRDTSLEMLSVEEIYHKLKEQKNWKKLYNLLFSDLLDWPDDDLSPDAYAKLEQYWREALQQARTLDEMVGHGTMPAGLQRELTHLSPSQLDWRSYLWRFMVQTPVDFQGFDRRFVGRGLYLDELAGERVRVFIAVDTSGSIGQKEIGLFLGEVQSILRAYPHLEASLYYADAACYGPYELTAESEIPVPKGGGGTDFRSFFQASSREADESTGGGYIYLTDGYGTFPTEAPSLPVLWVLSPGGISVQSVPFGEAVRLLPENYD